MTKKADIHIRLSEDLKGRLIYAISKVNAQTLPDDALTLSKLTISLLKAWLRENKEKEEVKL